MNRRKFIKLTVLFSITSPLTFSKCKLTSPKNKKVIVIGAGISGIAAARELQNHGFEVLILEARNRIGGRIWTDSSLGTPLDMGAGWIEEEEGNPISEIANSNGIKTVTSYIDSIYLYDRFGHLIPDNEFIKISNEYERITSRAFKYAESTGNDASYMQAIEYVIKDMKLPPEEKLIIDWIISTEELDNGTEFSNLSTWAEDLEGFEGEDVLFPDGYSQIPDALAKNLDIKLQHIVRKIQYNDQSVKVFTDDKSFESDYAVVTLPLGVLKNGSVEFSPPLPQSKVDIINKLGMGKLDKIALRFSEISWKTDRDYLGFVSDIKGEFPAFLNWAHYTGKPYLLTTIGGSYARSFENLTDEEAGEKAGEQAMKVLKKIDGNFARLAGVKIARWGSDPFTLGSYSHIPVGILNSVRDELAQPVGKLHFAGEATNRHYYATVHGAYLSGLREAKRILDSN